MKRVLLILAATLGLTLGGLLPTNTADAQIGVRGGYRGGGVSVNVGRGYYGYRGYNRPYYRSYAYGYRPYYRSYAYRPYRYYYGAPRYYSAYPTYYSYPRYGAYYGPGVYVR